jgi:hypothetical protein
MHIECLPVPSSLRFALANVVVTLSGRISSLSAATVRSEAVHGAVDIKSASKKPIARLTVLAAIPIKVKQGGNFQRYCFQEETGGRVRSEEVFQEATGACMQSLHVLCAILFMQVHVQESRRSRAIIILTDNDEHTCFGQS